MKRHLISLLILFMLSATVIRAQDASESLRFSISSVKSPFAMAGTFEGEYLIRDNSVEVTISSASVYLRNYGSYQGRRELAFINVALASINVSGGWKVVSHARAIPVGETLRPGDMHLVAEKMRFSIPKESSVDLSNCWLLVEMGELTLDTNAEGRVGYAFAHSARNIFSPVLARAARK